MEGSKRVLAHPAYVASSALADILKKIIKDLSLGELVLSSTCGEVRKEGRELGL